MRGWDGSENNVGERCTGDKPYCFAFIVRALEGTRVCRDCLEKYLKEFWLELAQTQFGFLEI